MLIRVDGDSGNITTPEQHHHTFNPAGSRIQVLACMEGNVILFWSCGEMSRVRGFSGTRLVDNRFMMSNRSDPEVQLSIVIPVYNEEACVCETLTELVDILNSGMTASTEIICVDDGSSDCSVDRIFEAMELNSQLRLVRLDRNYGQTAALDAGFRMASGGLVGMMDADGQNDPRDFPRLMKIMIDRELDMVCGVRKTRHDGVVRRISSRIANGFRNWATGDQVTDVGCSIRVFRAQCFGNIKLYEGMHRFFPTLFRMEGYRVGEISVNHRPRSGGMSKYGVRNRLWRGLRDVFAVRWMQSRSLQYQIRKN